MVSLCWIAARGISAVVEVCLFAYWGSRYCSYIDTDANIAPMHKHKQKPD